VEKEVTGKIETGEATPPPLKKVAIVGFSQHKVEAPYADPSFEIWGLNDLHESIPRWNRWFEMHSDKQIKDYCSRKAGVPYLEGLASLKCPVYMQKPRPEVPTSVRYPIEDMMAKFGNYFTNSISYMLALAIDEGYQVIHVYGVDMAQDSEYGQQRPSCEFFLGVARGRGCEIFLPKTSDLLKVRWLYGYEDEIQSSWDSRVDEIYAGIQGRRKQAEIQQQQAREACLQYLGAEDAIRTLKRIQVS
jgi:hypothetical protein